MIINYDYKNLRENLFNLKRFFENLGKLIKIKSRSCIENLFNFIFSKSLQRKPTILGKPPQHLLRVQREPTSEQHLVKVLFDQTNAKSADFRILNDITNEMPDASDILYLSTALV